MLCTKCNQGLTREEIRISVGCFAVPEHHWHCLTASFISGGDLKHPAADENNNNKQSNRYGYRPPFSPPPLSPQLLFLLLPSSFPPPLRENTMRWLAEPNPCLRLASCLCTYHINFPRDRNSHVDRLIDRLLLLLLMFTGIG